ITGFSVAPLRLASHLGFAMGIAGLLMLGYTFYSWISGQAVTGWTSLATLMLIIGSGQFMMLGIFGEYLGRMYMESKRRPLYFINEVRSTRVEARGETARELQESLNQALRA